MQFHWPHPYSLFLNFSRFSMFLLLNHWLQANIENISLCNVGHTHFRDHWSQYLYILQKDAEVQKGYCQNHTPGLWQSTEKDKRLGFWYNPGKARRSPFEIQIMQPKRVCPQKACREPPDNWHIYTVVLLDLSSFFKKYELIRT